ncbi:hypothetical protein NA56DRAFT_644872 [Hyaloscypha hepaticicola]|uniref:Uncharacterized protein n=1 Tax=Hyaloscypha hepaticicola TaxID=2082293 RepID=A0A2J6Q8Y9_9HELO|nr:hypothetical protein NA56DRAFT_644872 [Hyaloscypha hepaticicola]
MGCPTRLASGGRLDLLSQNSIRMPLARPVVELYPYLRTVMSTASKACSADEGTDTTGP